MRARPAPIALLALPCHAMSSNISAVTVGAGQDLGHHDTTRSCWVSLSLILLSRGADQHLWNTFLGTMPHPAPKDSGSAPAGIALPAPRAVRCPHRALLCQHTEPGRIVQPIYREEQAFSQGKIRLVTPYRCILTSQRVRPMRLCRGCPGLLPETPRR